MPPRLYAVSTPPGSRRRDVETRQGPTSYSRSWASPVSAKKRSDMSYAVTNPATGETVKTFDTISDADLQAAIATADDAFRTWSRATSVQDRAALVRRVGELHVVGRVGGRQRHRLCRQVRNAEDRRAVGDRRDRRRRRNRDAGSFAHRRRRSSPQSPHAPSGRMAVQRRRVVHSLPASPARRRPACRPDY